MPLRNLFKRSNISEYQLPDPEVNPDSSNSSLTKEPESCEPAEYQLSEIDDSGVFIPPSEDSNKPRFWHTKSTSTISSSTYRSSHLSSESEAFTISRESFDSYRRSFDISARSPVLSGTFDGARRSLDSSLAISSPPRPSITNRQSSDWPQDEELEEIKLNDDVVKSLPLKRRSLFARFGGGSGGGSAVDVIPEVKETAVRENDLGIKPNSGVYGFQLFSGRKRGQSGQGDELRSMSRSGTPTVVAVAD